MKTLANTFGLCFTLIITAYIYVGYKESLDSALYVLFFGSAIIFFFSLIVSLSFTIFLLIVTSSNIWIEYLFVFPTSILLVTIYVYRPDYSKADVIEHLTSSTFIAFISAFSLVPLNRWTEKKNMKTIAYQQN